MLEYSFKGLKFFYPAHIVKQGDFPFLDLNKCNDTWGKLSITLHDKDYNIKKMVDPDTYKDIHMSEGGFELIKAGRYNRFPGSKEILYKVQLCANQSAYFWLLFIPVVLKKLFTAKQRFITIQITDSYCPEDSDNIWVPIVNSLKFDPQIIIGLPDSRNCSDILFFDWSNIPNCPRHIFHKSYFSDVGVKALYNVQHEPLDDDLCGYSDDFLENLDKNNFIKLSNTLVLSSLQHDLVDIDVHFYFNTKPPTNEDYLFAIEGLIEFPDGIIYFGDYLEISEMPEIKIRVEPGNYAFRVHWQSNDDDDEIWHIYLNPII